MNMNIVIIEYINIGNIFNMLNICKYIVVHIKHASIADGKMEDRMIIMRKRRMRIEVSNSAAHIP